MITSKRLVTLLALVALATFNTAVYSQSGQGNRGHGSDPWASANQPLALGEDTGAEAGEESAYEETSTQTHGDSQDPLLWEGFLYGDQHFKSKPRPIGSPLYFEDPFINSDIRPFFLYHEFPRGTALRGGRLIVYGLQARIALTDRLQFFATEDGYSDIESPIIPSDEGWNDLAAGLKYAFYVDHEEDFIASAGLRWRLSNGDSGLLQGGTDELSPFITMYKGYGKWNFLADVVYRLPTDWEAGNSILSWDFHVNYELFEDFFPVIEVHGLHYLTDGKRLPLNVGGVDYANIGANGVAGNSVFWGGAGFRWNLAEHVQFGALYEFPLQDPDSNDIFEQRFTTSFVFTF